MRAKTNTSAVEPRGRGLKQGSDPQEAGIDPYSKRGCAEDRDDMSRHRFQQQGGQHGGTVRAYVGQHHKIDGAKYGAHVMRSDAVERPGNRLPVRKAGFPVK